MMLNRNKGSNDSGVMSILKVSADEKFHMKQSNGYLIPTPIGTDTSLGFNNNSNMYKT